MGTIREAGPVAWLVETDEVLGFAAAVRDARRPGGLELLDVVPGAETVLVVFEPAVDRHDVRDWLAALSPHPDHQAQNRTVTEIPVRYDGDDLDDVAVATGLTVDDVVHRHSAVEYRCAFCGFAPGFGYLTGLDRQLHLPRRPTPRTRVPAGAVAIAAAYAAVYPSTSPGGWHLLGRTDEDLWRADRDPPALLAPGARVRFVPVEG